MAITRFHGDRQIEDGTIDKDDLNTSLKNEIDAKVVGPASSTDNAIARFDGTTGKLLQNSGGVTINDSNGLLATDLFAPGSVVTSTISEFSVGDGVTIDGTLIKDGNVDGRDVSADGTKLDGIESNATADQTAGEIKTAYESNADTNAFTDSEQTKLTGIETGAEVNNISDANATDLTDAGDSALHFHSADRNRANHTGTQPMSTISDAGDLATKSTVASTDLAESFYRGRYQANTTNSTQTGITVQFGWGYITGTGASRLGTKTITFPTSYTTILSVTISAIGAYSGAGTPSAITDFTGLSDNIVNASSITASAFEALSATRSGGNLISGTDYGFTWVAYGIV